MIPTISITSKEFESGSVHKNTVLKALDLYNTNGCLLLENVFSPTFITTLHASYMRRYERGLQDDPNAESVAKRRFMIQVELRAPFNRPRLYANPLVIPILRQLLGQEFILGAFGSLVSLPGASNQIIHWDHEGLFEDNPINEILPSYALIMLIPLIELNKLTGATRLCVGSHILPTEEALKIEAEDPLAPVGSCLLVDYRLRHGGAANRSQQLRPILYSVYCRSWFRDTHSYNYQQPIKISETEYRKIPRLYRKLFYLASTSKA